MVLIVDDPELEQARQKLEFARLLDPNVPDAEKAHEAHEKNFEAKRLIDKVRKEHAGKLRQMELDNVMSYFQHTVQQHARPSEIEAFEKLTRTTQRSIERNDEDFMRFLNDLKSKNFEILWRQDWFVIEFFKWMAASPHAFMDTHYFKKLIGFGMQFMSSADMESLREVADELWRIRLNGFHFQYEAIAVNIIRG